MSFEPETALIECSTSKGDIAMELYRAWSPNGFDRAVSLYEQGFYDQSYLYRVIPGFLVQFGISYTKDHSLQALADEKFSDDPLIETPIEFEKGIVSFAADIENGRSSQLFIALGKHSFGSKTWEVPIGKVIKGMPLLDLRRSYGDVFPLGSGPDPEMIRSQGKEYVQDNFPRLDFIKTCTVERLGGYPPKQETQSPFQALSEKFAVDMQPNPEQLAFFGLCTMLVFIFSFFNAKMKYGEEKDKELIDMFTETKATKKVKFSPMKKERRTRAKNKVQ